MEKDQNISVSVLGQTFLREHQDKTPLLETLEQHNIEIPSHCREGFCGVCRTQLLSGQVEYTIDPLAYVDDNEILPCCCRPITSISIKP